MLNDLRPYLCIFREFSHALWGALLGHELSVHRDDSESKNVSNSFKRTLATSAGKCYPWPNGRSVFDMLVTIWKRLL